MKHDPALGAKRTLVVVFVAATAMSLAFRTYSLSSPREQLEALGAVALLMTIFGKLAFVLAVLRLSIVLRKPVALTAFYCTLAPFAVLYLIPFFALLFSSARPDTADDRQGGKALGAQSASGRAPCPFCAEDIRRNATLCRYCRCDLPSGWAAPSAIKASSEAIATAPPSTPPAPVDRVALELRMQRLRTDAGRLDEQAADGMRSRTGRNR